MGTYQGADWLQRVLRKEISPFGRKIADLIGDLWEGIYHIDDSSLLKADWSNPHTIVLVLSKHLATFDGDALTRLVILCHDRMIRCEIAGIGPGYLKIWFSERTCREGSLYDRHPTIEAAVERVRKHYGEPAEPTTEPARAVATVVGCVVL